MEVKMKKKRKEGSKERRKEVEWGREGRKNREEESGKEGTSSTKTFFGALNKILYS